VVEYESITSSCWANLTQANETLYTVQQWDPYTHAVHGWWNIPQCHIGDFKLYAGIIYCTFKVISPKKQQVKEEFF